MSSTQISTILDQIAQDIVMSDITEGGYYIVREEDGIITWHYARVQWPPMNEDGEVKDALWIPMPKISDETWGVIEDHQKEYRERLVWAMLEGYSAWERAIARQREAAQATNKKVDRATRIAAAHKAWKTKRAKARGGG